MQYLMSTLAHYQIHESSELLRFHSFAKFFPPAIILYTVTDQYEVILLLLIIFSSRVSGTTTATIINSRYLCIASNNPSIFQFTGEKESSAPTKVYALFDKSAKSASNVSLDDILLVEPLVHPT